MDNQDFLECTKKALDYIKEVDDRIFNRVKNELEYIVNTELNSGATYVQRMKRCDIDFGRYPIDKDYELYFHHYVSSIVHEATHGFLFSKGIGYNKKNRARVERICCNASAIFLRKTSFERVEDVVKEFDESRWYSSWHGSDWQKLKSLLQRMKESRKKECEAKQQVSG